MRFKEGDIVLWSSRSVTIECQVLYVEQHTTKLLIEKRALITPLQFNQTAENNWNFLHAVARQMPIEEYTAKVYPYKHQRGGFATFNNLTLAPRLYTIHQLLNNLRNEIRRG